MGNRLILIEEFEYRLSCTVEMKGAPFIVERTVKYQYFTPSRAMPGSRVVGIKLTEPDLASLNLKLRQDVYDALSDLVRAYISGAFKVNDSLTALIAEKVVQRLTSSSKTYIMGANQEGTSSVFLGSSSSLV